MKLEYIKKHSTLVIIVFLIVLVVAGILARAASKKTVGQQPPQNNPLTLIKAKDYSQNIKIISANGTIESLQQVDLKSLSNGKITNIYVKTGDHVSQGQVLAIIDQSGAQAGLTSAQGGLAQAQAGYNRLLAGASAEQIAQAQAGFDSAMSALENTRRQQDLFVEIAYKTLLNTSLSATPDRGNQNTIPLTISGSYTGKDQGKYEISLYITGNGAYYTTSGLGNESGPITKNVELILGNGLSVTFPESVNLTYSGDKWTVSIPNTQGPTYTAVNSAYEAALETKKSSIKAAENAVALAQSALNLAKAQARPVDIDAAKAAILTAQGQVQGAQTVMENTFIRAPFSGTVSSFLPKYAELVIAGQKIASLVNIDGLLIKAHVSSEDLPYIKLKAAVKIGETNVEGIITNMAPSVDANTRTAEVSVAVSDPKNSGLTIGQNVAVNIFGESQNVENIFLLPLQAVKINSEGKAFVFTVNSEGKAESHEVEIGQVDGEKVEVKNGVTKNMELISNAYDVSEGDTVQEIK